MSGKDSIIVNICAYIALFIAALLSVFMLLDIGGSQLTTWLSITRDVALLIGLGVPAFVFARSTQKKFWIILYWISFTIYLVVLAVQVLKLFGIL